MAERSQVAIFGQSFKINLRCRGNKTKDVKVSSKFDDEESAQDGHSGQARSPGTAMMSQKVS